MSRKIDITIIIVTIILSILSTYFQEFVSSINQTIIIQFEFIFKCTELHFKMMFWME